jgi:hypothetical protein
MDGPGSGGKPRVPISGTYRYGVNLTKMYLCMCLGAMRRGDIVCVWMAMF